MRLEREARDPGPALTLGSVFADQQRRARALLGIRRGPCGSVTLLQRFGSALNLTPNFHSLVLDGVYAGPSHSPGPFVALPALETEDVARVLAGAARRILRLLERIGADVQDDPIAGEDPLMAMLGAASIRSRIATGTEAGEPWRRLGDRVEPALEDEAGVEPSAILPPRCVRHGGMSLHADVAVPARDRRRLEGICRYVARPPLALDRLEALVDGRLAYRPKTPRRDGTTHVVMERRELLERLAPLIPPPRAHQVRYHGVLAPCASGRDRVVPGQEGIGGEAGSGEKDTSRPRLLVMPHGRVPARDPGHGPEAGAAGREPDEEAAHDPRRPGSTEAGDAGANVEIVASAAPPDVRAEVSAPRARLLAWADLLKRIFEVDALRCLACGGRMRLIAAITDPSVASRILACLALPPRAPPLGPADAIDRGRGLEPSLSDQLTLEATERDPGFDFDQSPIEGEGSSRSA